MRDPGSVTGRGVSPWSVVHPPPFAFNSAVCSDEAVLTVAACQGSVFTE